MVTIGNIKRPIKAGIQWNLEDKISIRSDLTLECIQCPKSYKSLSFRLVLVHKFLIIIPSFDEPWFNLHKPWKMVLLWQNYRFDCKTRFQRILFLLLGIIRNYVKMNCIPKKIMKKLILAKSQCQMYKLCIIWGNLIFNGPCIRKTANLQKDPDTNKCCIRDRENNHYHPTFTEKCIIGIRIPWLNFLLKVIGFLVSKFFYQ